MNVDCDESQRDNSEKDSKKTANVKGTATADNAPRPPSKEASDCAMFSRGICRRSVRPTSNVKTGWEDATNPNAARQVKELAIKSKQFPVHNPSVR